VREVEQGLSAGKLAPGQPLPSVRALASEVGLSPATVAAGLAELRRRGVIVTEERRGTRISYASPGLTGMASVPVPPGAVDLSRGNPDSALLPDLTRALASIELPQRLYGEPAAVSELLDLAREQLRADDILGHDLCVVSGALDGIERVLAVHLRPGDRVAVENPGYAALFHLLRAHGLGLEPVLIDDRGMLPESLQLALSRGVRALVITPRGQNPTGAALDGERARELRALLERFPGTLVLEDDHLGEVAGSPLHSLAAASERWAATRSVAKALGPDLRLAILAGDPQSIARVQALQTAGPGWVSHILQRLVLALLMDSQIGALVKRARDTYTDRRRWLLERLAAHGIAASGRSGLNVWIPVAEETSVVAAALERGWVLQPGSPYRLADAAPAVRVTISALELEQATRLADDLAGVIGSLGCERSG
jgi:DNA-binding transcriptional MocR family regulator